MSVSYVILSSGGGGEGVLPCMVDIGICVPKGYGFPAVLVVNRIWFLHSCLGLCIFFSTFSSLLIRPSAKALHKLCLGQLCQLQQS